MALEGEIKRIVQLYPDDCQPHGVEPLRPAASFSGARLWRLSTPRGPLCLRRWPAEHPTPERLEFVQAVLWHVDQEGFHQIPLPLETRHHHGFVRHAGHLWELAPWLAGEPDYREHPNRAKLENAMTALARFHRAAGSFPLAETGPAGSPGIRERTERLESLHSGGLARIARAVVSDAWPELATRGRRLIDLSRKTGRKIRGGLDSARRLDVAIQPCIRDVWHAHVLFQGDEVTGILDFGSMRPDNVAADVARLLGSLARDDREDWQRGLAAYQSVRPLSDDELRLATAFDRSTVVLGGLQWLEWVYVEGRRFDDRPAVLARVDEFLERLESLAQAVR